MTTYAGNRRCADADSHLMEEPGWLASFADASVRDRLPDFSAEVAAAVKAGMARRPDGPIDELSPKELLGAKGWAAIGALDPSERTKALDILGFEQQIVFPTFAPTQFMFSKDDDLFYGGIDALNRGMAETCAADERLLAVGFVSLRDPDRAMVALERALDVGCRAVLVPSAADGNRSPAHVLHDPVWARTRRLAFPSCVTSGSGPAACGRRGTTMAARSPRTISAGERTYGPRTSLRYTTTPRSS